MTGRGSAREPAAAEPVVAEPVVVEPGAAGAEPARERLRALGLVVGGLPPGPRNSIADVAGVSVGHVTIEDDEGRAPIRTGVTVVVPSARDLWREPLAAAVEVVNGYGKSLGLVQVAELGELETPIWLTTTMGVPAVAQGALDWLADRDPEVGAPRTVNVVVAECNDGATSDARAGAVRPEHAGAALRDATVDVVLGGVGAGTGMTTFGYRGGVGTSSRVLDGVTLGALVVSNFGRPEDFAPTGWLHRADAGASASAGGQGEHGSILTILATDADLDPHTLHRIARRAVVGIARAGGRVAHGSGEVALAFSAPGPGARTPRGSELDGLFEMVAEAVHEAILDAMCTAAPTVGREGPIPALPYGLLVPGPGPGPGPGPAS